MEKAEISGKRSLETSPNTDKNTKTNKKKKVNEGKDDPQGSGESEIEKNDLENEEEEINTDSVKSIASSTTSKKSEDNGNRSCEAPELMAEAKKDAKLVKSKLVKRGSKDAIESVDNLFSIIAAFTSQLAFAKEKVKVAPQEKKTANNYATITQRIVGTKDTKRLNTGQKTLLVVINTNK